MATTRQSGTSSSPYRVGLDPHQGRPAANAPAQMELTSDQDHRKEAILTQDAPSKQGETSNATILKRGDVYFLSDNAGNVPWQLPHAFAVTDANVSEGRLHVAIGQTFE
jgi:hypothetical protein